MQHLHLKKCFCLSVHLPRHSSFREKCGTSFPSPLLLWNISLHLRILRSVFLHLTLGWVFAFFLVECSAPLSLVIVATHFPVLCCKICYSLWLIVFCCSCGSEDILEIIYNKPTLVKSPWNYRHPIPFWLPWHPCFTDRWCAWPTDSFTLLEWLWGETGCPMFVYRFPCPKFGKMTVTLNTVPKSQAK